jgi:hypothetical protein
MTYLQGIYSNGAWIRFVVADRYTSIYPHPGARLTSRVSVDTDARARFVVEYSDI